MNDHDHDLDELQMELLSFEGRGYHCSQILLLMALRQTGGERNDDLVRAMGGLSLGLGHSNGTCGAAVAVVVAFRKVRARMARCSTRDPCAAVSRGRQAAQRESAWRSGAVCMFYA